VDGTFSVVYLVWNTIMNLTSQAAQVACFRNAAAHGDRWEFRSGEPKYRAACRDLVLGLGTLHCLTQQQPSAAAGKR
jgi:hypothetical protein